MHEFSVMDEVMRLLRQSAEEEGIREITSIRMKVGQMSCLHPPALKTAFATLGQDDALFNKAKLIIDEQPVVMYCENCDTETEIEVYEFICPDCDSSEVRIIEGEEAIIESYEGSRN